MGNLCLLYASPPEFYSLDMTDLSAVTLRKEGPLLRVIFLEEGGAEEYPM